MPIILNGQTLAPDPALAVAPKPGNRAYLRAEIAAFHVLLGSRAFWLKTPQARGLAATGLSHAWMATDDATEADGEAFWLALDAYTRRDVFMTQHGIPDDWRVSR